MKAKATKKLVCPPLHSFFGQILVEQSDRTTSDNVRHNSGIMTQQFSQTFRE
jgi:hypothetical protein